MSPRGLWVLLVLLALGVAAVMWLERPPEADPPAQTLGSLLPGDLEAVRALEIEREGAGVRIERGADGRGWTLTHPWEAEADPREVEGLFRAVSEARIERVVEDTPSDLSMFGLDPPAAVLRVVALGEAPAPALRLGRASPVGGGRYAAGADGRVLLVDGSAASALFREAESFRERRLLPVDPERVRLVRIDRPSGRLVLAREQDGWRLREPVEDLADAAAAEAIVRSLASLSGDPVEDAAQQRRALEALRPPRLVVGIETTDGESVAPIEIAARGPSDGRYARRAGAERPAVVRESAARELERDADDLRDRRLVLASDAEVREIRIERDGAPEIRASRAGAGEPWSITEGGTVAGVAAPGRVGDLVDRLRWLRAMSFKAPSPAAGGSPARFVLGGASGDLGWIEIDGAPGAASGTIGARSSWRPGVRFGIAEDALPEPPRSATSWLEPEEGVGKGE